MKVKRHGYLKDQLICELTEKLTDALQYSSECIHVYVLDYIWNTEDKEKVQYPIRMTGRTIGVLNLTHDNYITSIVIDADCRDLFKDDISDMLRAYIGERFMVEKND